MDERSLGAGGGRRPRASSKEQRKNRARRSKSSASVVAKQMSSLRARQWLMLCGLRGRHAHRFRLRTCGVLSCTSSHGSLLLYLLGRHPGSAGVPFSQDLEPGPHQTIAGLAWKAAHAAGASSSDGSAEESSQPQRSRSSLMLRAPSCFLARSSVVTEIASSFAATRSSLTGRGPPSSSARSSASASLSFERASGSFSASKSTALKNATPRSVRGRRP